MKHMYGNIDPGKKTALVTGGNRGIGLEIAKGLLKSNLNVILACRDAKHGVEIADRIGAMFLFFELTDPFCFAGDIFDVDILVNNAGVLFDEPLFTRKARFSESMDVMVNAPYELMRQAVAGMTLRNYGRIVNISSEWGSFSQGLGGGGAYAIAKAALNAMTVIADRDTPDFIKVNAMCPGWTHTRMGGDGATRSAAETAITAIWLATLPEDGPSGGFFRDCKEFGW